MKTDSMNAGLQVEFQDEVKQATIAISSSHQTKVVATLIAKWLHDYQEVNGDEPSAA